MIYCTASPQAAITELVDFMELNKLTEKLLAGQPLYIYIYWMWHL